MLGYEICADILLQDFEPSIVHIFWVMMVASGNMVTVVINENHDYQVTEVVKSKMPSRSAECNPHMSLCLFNCKMVRARTCRKLCRVQVSNYA